MLDANFISRCILFSFVYFTEVFSLILTHLFIFRFVVGVSVVTATSYLKKQLLFQSLLTRHREENPFVSPVRDSHAFSDLL